MKSSLKKLPQSQVELTFTIEADQLAQARETAYQRLAPQVKVPGFRPGKAPRTMVEQYLNPMTLMQQAIDAALNTTYQEVIREQNIVPLANPDVHLDEVDFGKPLQVTATVPVRPAVTLGDYTKVTASKETPTIEDAKVQEMLQTIFERSQQQSQQESLKSKVNKAEQGEIVDADGKPLTQAQAQMDDAWAQGLGAKDLAELTAQVRADLEAQAKYEAEQKWQEAIIDELIQLTTVELPEVFVQDELRRMRDQFGQQLAAVGISLEQYLKQSNKTEAELEEQWRPQAEKQATLEAALVELSNKEGIKVDDTEIDAELEKLDAKTRARFTDPDQRYYLNYSLWRQKVLRKLFEYAESK